MAVASNRSLGIHPSRAAWLHVTRASEQPRVSAGGSASSLDQLLLSKPTTHNIVDYHLTPEESFQAILGALASAKQSFHVECFIWHDDETGRQLAQALVRKVQDAKARGETFDAKVLLDSFGVKYGDLGTRDRNIVDYLRANGVEVQILNPRMLSVKSLGVPITHRKLFIADGERYVIGGRNVGNEYLQSKFELKHGRPETTMNSLHDLMVSVQGDEAARVEAEFYKNWVRAGGTVPSELPQPKPALGGHTSLQTFVTDPVSGEHGIQDVQLNAIANAQREIFVITPYLGDKTLLRALTDAKEKNPNLSIKVLLPANGEMGKKNLNYEMDLSSAETLLKAGIEVRMTPGGIENGQQLERFSHLKALVIDDEVMTVGSSNSDYRSFHNNHEIVNLIADAQKVQEFEQTIADPDWKAAKPIDADWIRQNTTFLERIVRFFGKLFSFLY